MPDRRQAPDGVDDFRYRLAPDFWVITSYYNPCHYRSRRRNYDLFARALRRSGIPLLTVECAFGEEPYDLEESPETVRVRSQSGSGRGCWSGSGVWVSNPAVCDRLDMVRLPKLLSSVPRDTTLGVCVQEGPVTTSADSYFGDGTS